MSKYTRAQSEEKPEAWRDIDHDASSPDFDTVSSSQKFIKTKSTTLLHDNNSLNGSVKTGAHQPGYIRSRLSTLLASNSSRNEIAASSCQRVWRILQPKRRSDAQRSCRPTHRGWRKAVAIAGILTGVVTALNIVFTVVSILKFGIEQGIGTIYTGRCTNVNRWNTALHLLINVFGTILLGASSYTMQCLNSPTRSELDRAHAKGISLDIGILSFRNLFHLHGWKRIIWLILGLSTLPLHFFWNSTVFATDGTNLFSYVLADEEFLHGASWAAPNTSTINKRGSYYIHDGVCSGQGHLAFAIQNIYAGYNAGTYSNITAAQCLAAYTTGDGSSQRNLILITKPDVTLPMSQCGYSGRLWDGSSVTAVDVDVLQGVDWIFNYDLSTKYFSTTGSAPDSMMNRARISRAEDDARTNGTWHLGPYTVEYCLSETSGIQGCKLQFVPYVLYVVTACNLVKTLCMFATMCYLWDLDEPILATVGDAVSSFLRHEDIGTSGRCLLDYQQISKRQPLRGGALHSSHFIYNRKPSTRLKSATTSRKWWSTMMLCLAYLASGVGALAYVVRDDGGSLPDAMSNFGVDEGRVTSMDDTGSEVSRAILISNLFQFVLSVTYYQYNSLFTAQCAAKEWASYAQGNLKSLRVTWPEGQQRSTYYLHLPWRYGIPLMAFLMLMHFLISQSLFMAQLIDYDSVGVPILGYGYCGIGWSPAAILTSCCVGLLLIVAQIANSFRRLNNMIPIHKNQSMVISAMCHLRAEAAGINSVLQSQVKIEPIEKETKVGVEEHSQEVTDDMNIAMKPIMWGVTEESRTGIILADEGDWDRIHQLIGHCSFTDKVVDQPTQGMLYC